MPAFQPVFEGIDREARHRMLADLIQPRFSLGTREHRDADIATVKLAMSDPSLMTEHLSSDFGVQVYRYQRGGQYEPTGTAGTWLMMAASKGMIRTVRCMLEMGVHPDDPEVFMSGGLLSNPTWAHVTDGLELATQFGANPDVQIQPTVDGRWAGTPAQVQVRLLGTKSVEPAGPLRRLRLLLEAGAKCTTLDVDEKYRPTQIPAVTAAYAVASHRNGNSAEYREQAIPVLRLLGQSGADLDAHGPTGDAPLLAAMRVGSMELVKTLIELGCRTEGISSRKPEATLQEVATEVMGTKNAAEVWTAVNAKVMRDQMSTFPGANEASKAAPAPRRMTRMGI